MIIDKCPKSLQAFVSPMAKRLSKPQRARLWMVLVAWVMTGRLGKVLRWALASKSGHRTSFAAFLTRSQWDSGELLRSAVDNELRRLRPQRGESLEWLIDDTRIAKRGRKMAALSKLWDHAEQRFVHGHIIVTVALRFRGIIWPWRLELWLPVRYVGKRRYRKMTDIAAQMIRDLPAFDGLCVRVLFDAFYLCPQVTKACAARGWHWYSVASRNRKFTPDEGRSRKARKLGTWCQGFLRHHGQRVRMRRSRGWRWLNIAAATGHLSRIGEVRVVVSKRPKDQWKNVVNFVTNATELQARDIVANYERRWDIETLFKELKGTLGLGAYQVLNEQGICHHLHLCCLTHIWLTRQSLDALDAKARKAKEVSLPPLSQRIESSRASMRAERLTRLLQRTQEPRWRRKLKHCLAQLLPASLAA
jgi:SRSO17 transposase